MSDVFEVSYIFHRNDVGSLQTVTVDIKRIHSVDIVALRKLNTEPSIGATHKVSLYLAKQLQGRFLEIDQPETRIAYGSPVC